MLFTATDAIGRLCPNNFCKENVGGTGGPDARASRPGSFETTVEAARTPELNFTRKRGCQPALMLFPGEEWQVGFCRNGLICPQQPPFYIPVDGVSNCGRDWLTAKGANIPGLPAARRLAGRKSWSWPSPVPRRGYTINSPAGRSHSRNPGGDRDPVQSRASRQVRDRGCPGRSRWRSSLPSPSGTADSAK
jgi:hypothetical protein